MVSDNVRPPTAATILVKDSLTICRDLPLARRRTLDDDISLARPRHQVADELVALGAFAAAAAAVWVATTDRRVRGRERDTKDAARAKLVVVTAQCQENPLEIQVRVVNYGTRAIR